MNTKDPLCKCGHRKSEHSKGWCSAACGPLNDPWKCSCPYFIPRRQSRPRKSTGEQALRRRLRRLVKEWRIEAKSIPGNLDWTWRRHARELEAILKGGSR